MVFIGFIQTVLPSADWKRMAGSSLQATSLQRSISTGNSAWFCGEIRPCVGRIVVVKPKQFQVIRKKKTDQNNASALAFFLSKDMLVETRLKSVAERELASMVHTHDVPIKQRTRLLNKIHALYVRHGVKLKKESLSSKRAIGGRRSPASQSLSRSRSCAIRR